MKKRTKSFMGSKAQNSISILLLIIIVVFVLSIVSLTSLKIFSDINDELQAEDYLSDDSKAILQDGVDDFPSMFDGALLFIIGFLTLLLMVQIMFSSNPIWLIVIIVLLVLLFSVAMIISNYWDEVINSDDYSDFSNSFPYTNFLLSNLPYVVIGLLSLIGFSMFIRSRFIE